MAEPAGEVFGVVMSHVRSEDSGQILESLEELFRQCAGTSAKAHVSHLKIVHGRDVQEADAVLKRMAEWRAKGLSVTADVYPYTASYTGIGIVYPSWAKRPHPFPKVRSERRAELQAFLRERIAFRGGPEATLFGSGKYAGKTLAQLASELKQPFEDVLIDHFPPGSASAAYFVMSEEVMKRFLLDPFVMLSSDGSPTMRHPRGHGAFARFLGRHVVGEGLLPMEEAIRKITSLPAQVLGLEQRGRLVPGFHADVLVFDREQVRDLATYEEPHRLARGFDTVIVNGALVRSHGKFTEKRAGVLLLGE